LRARIYVKAYDLGFRAVAMRPCLAESVFRVEG
jgi:hypothetical protein